MSLERRPPVPKGWCSTPSTPTMGRGDRTGSWQCPGTRGSEFILGQNQDGVFCSSDKNFLRMMGANLVGSKYQIWGQLWSFIR